MKSRFGEEKTGHLESATLNRNSSQAVRIRLGTSPSKKTKGKTKEEYLARLPARMPAPSRVQGFLGGIGKTGAKGRSARPRRRERSRRRSRKQPWAREKGCENSAVVHTMWSKRQRCLGEVRAQWSIVRMAKRREKASVCNAWQISPICRLPVVGAFVLDGTKRFHDKPQGRSVMRDAKKGSVLQAASEQRKCEHMKVRQLFQRR